MAAARASLSHAIPRPSSPRPNAVLAAARLRWPGRLGGAARGDRRRKKAGFPIAASAAVERSPSLLLDEEKVDALLDSIKWDEKGLAVAIAQNSDTGAILMQGFVNREALAKTITSRKATFYSRSRSSLWTKGETSMNFINVCEIFLDCDRDSIIYLGKPDGPTCHTGSETCYFSSASDILRNGEAHNHGLALTTLYSLEDTIHRRRDEIGNATDGKPSWTKRLLLDNELLCSKVREEAEELVQTLLGNEDRSRTVSEMGDLMYHAMVLLAVKGVKMEEVLEALRERFAQSGIEEKSSRKKPN
ncbi:unnamed protein product [Spirodela intermedia]|uniref:Phosphoribosyl-AMP cyclohydrolase domain-containing protein n=1 Tax=Spirodela intermedia TaxID=51605 RepID=A0A7I8KDK7_SPIIN|nr:unnamed protein product [Spirodela intermedia]